MPSLTDKSGEGGGGTDQAFRALCNPIRRQLLLALHDSSPRQLSELADLTVDTDDKDSVVTALYHHHLPQLDDVGYTDTNWDRKRISRGEQFDAIRSLLRLLNENSTTVPGNWP